MINANKARELSVNASYTEAKEILKGLESKIQVLADHGSNTFEASVKKYQFEYISNTLEAHGFSVAIVPKLLGSDYEYFTISW